MPQIVTSQPGPMIPPISPDGKQLRMVGHKDSAAITAIHLLCAGDCAIKGIGFLFEVHLTAANAKALEPDNRCPRWASLPA